ncbi:uncharacterized protein FFFS_14195 [Fusarium fujikuroi]
MWFY